MQFLELQRSGRYCPSFQFHLISLKGFFIFSLNDRETAVRLKTGQQFIIIKTPR